MKPEVLEMPGISGSIAALGFGNPANPPILALHGWLDNAASFIPLAGFLEEYYLVAMDFAGHGFSQHRPSGTKYHLVDYVADVAHVSEKLGWEQFNLLGHSLGAGVSIIFAAAYPERIRKMILIDGVGPTSGAADTATDRLRKSIDAGVKQAFGSESSPKIYNNWQAIIDARRAASPVSLQSAELLVRRNATERRHGIVLHSDRRLRHPSALYLTEDMVLHFIEQVSAPTLILLAKNGVVMHRKQTAKRGAAFRNALVSECEGQHHLHMDSPAAIATQINEFLKR